MTLANLRNLQNLLFDSGYETCLNKVGRRDILHKVGYRYQLKVFDKKSASSATTYVSLYLLEGGTVTITSNYARLPGWHCRAEYDPYLLVKHLLEKLEENWEYKCSIGD